MSKRTLFELADAEAKTICEYGCGAGAIARAVNAKFPYMHCVGVELMPDALIRPRQVLQFVVVGRKTA